MQQSAAFPFPTFSRLVFAFVHHHQDFRPIGGVVIGAQEGGLEMMGDWRPGFGVPRGTEAAHSTPNTKINSDTDDAVRIFFGGRTACIFISLS